MAGTNGFLSYDICIFTLALKLNLLRSLKDRLWCRGSQGVNLSKCPFHATGGWAAEGSFIYLLTITSCSTSTAAWRLHYCTSKWPIYCFQLITLLLSTLHADAAGLTPWIQTYATAPRTHTFCSAVSSSTRAQYTLCFHRRSLASGVSRVTHENRLQRARAHMQPSLSDQMIQKRLHWLYTSGFPFFISTFLFSALHHTAASVFFSFFLSTV